MFFVFLTFLIPTIISFIFSTAASSLSNTNSSIISGHLATIKSLVPKQINFEYISYVTNGINGCNNFKEEPNT